MDTNYKQNVEAEFEGLVKYHQNRTKGATGIEDVLQFLVDRHHDGKIWYWAWEFAGRSNSKGAYLSHRACARASDLALHYSDLVEDRKIGRFKVYRLKVENMELIQKFLNHELAKPVQE